MTKSVQRRERGMVLVNVLLIVALAAAVLTVMLATQDASFQRTGRLREAAQANAIAHGGELSVIAELRRDAVRTPNSDSRAERWANIGDEDTRIEGGRFSLAVSDAQARFNVNGLARGDVASAAAFAQIVTALRLDPAIVTRTVALLSLTGPIGDLGRLRDAGVSDEDVATLATLVTALPTPTSINLNDMDEALLAILLGNPRAAAELIGTRAREGALTTLDVARAGVVLPPGVGFTSDYYWVRVRVTIGATSQQVVTLLRRDYRRGGPVVEPVLRWRGATVPAQAPALAAIRR